METISDIRNPQPQPLIGIIIPFYNGDAFITECLSSIRCSDKLALRVYIINNSSRFSGLNLICKQFRNVDIVTTTPSIGFGAACNIGARHAVADGAEFLVILNQDTILKETCIDELIGKLQNDNSLGIAGPICWKIGFLDIEDYYVRHYLSECSAIVAYALRGSLAPLYLTSNLPGACIAIPVSTYQKMGLFDDVYYMYSEDDDLCRRYTFAGFKIAIVAGAHVGHFNSLAQPKARKRIFRQRRISFRVFRLKDVSKSFSFTLFKSLAYIPSDYLRALSKMELSLLFLFVFDDFLFLLRLPRIYKARVVEADRISKYAS